MTTQDALYKSEIPHLKLLARGKVRDMYEIDDQHLLIVTTDRISAFDVILPDPIPGKGAVLTRVAKFWFNFTSGILPNHLSQEIELADIIKDARLLELLASRSMIVKRLRPLPVEAIVRGYLIGSGWKDYQAGGAVCGIPLPPGLQLAQQLERPLYTPSSKAEIGVHDQNISFADTESLIGPELAAQVRDQSLQIYTQAAEYARQRGIIIADTKFEFGVDAGNRLYLIDEVLTPDSSRFWPADAYQAGVNPPSFDKQYLRDYLETLDWNKTAPGPRLPAEVTAQIAAKYHEAEQRLTQAQAE